MKLQTFAILPALTPCVMGLPQLTFNVLGCPIASLLQETPGAMQAAIDVSMKLADAEWPYQPPGPGDIRGPCPGLNTLANHGWINRTGVTTPQDIISAVQGGFNMGPKFATFLTFSAFLVDGNQTTNLISIGRNTSSTPGGPIDIPGLNTHGTFEGDASMTREDDALGNNHDFNQILFDLLNHTAQLIGSGSITIEAMALARKLRVDESIFRNPTFFYETPRFLGANAESGFAMGMFVSNQTQVSNLPLSVNDAFSFFGINMFPDNFIRRPVPFEWPEVKALASDIIGLVNVSPGRNFGRNNYVVNQMDHATWCEFYHGQVYGTVKQYPNDTISPDLREALKMNLLTYYESLDEPWCEQLFPYGNL